MYAIKVDQCVRTDTICGFQGGAWRKFADVIASTPYNSEIGSWATARLVVLDCAEREKENK